MVVYYCKVHSDRFGISLSCVWKESMSLTVNYKINILKSPKFLVFCKSFINCSIKRIFKCHVLKTGNLFNFTCCLCMFCTLLKGQLLWQICKTSSKIGGCYRHLSCNSPHGDFGTFVPQDILVEYLVCWAILDNIIPNIWSFFCWHLF